MSQLSEEQRLRAEQNRLKALQIRQQKMAALAASGASQISSGSHQTTAGLPQPSTGPPKVTMAAPRPATTYPQQGRSVPGTSNSTLPQPSTGPSKVTTAAPRPSTTSPPTGVGPRNFYPQQGRSVSGTSNSTTGGNVNNPHGSSQSTNRIPQAAANTTGAEPGTRISGTGSSSLPPDVQRRIEENKRKAQERREYLKKMRAEQGTGAPPAPSASSSTPAGRNLTPNPTPNSTPAARNLTPNPTPNSTPAARNSFQIGSQASQPSTAGPKSSNKPSVSKPSRIVTVSFSLSSATRFRANCSFYQTAVIQVFKTIESRNYDCNTRAWSFHINDHKSLVAALRPLHPEVEVVPLPTFVLKALEAAARKVPADCIDLTGLDARLLDALMPFQAEGVKFGISLGGRVMLADDMGLGKTIQALGIACHYQPEWPMLVVTPSSMRYSWEESILRWVSFMSHQDVRVITTGNDDFRDAQVVVVSYDQLSRKADTFLHHKFGVVILDESHMIKNYKSARYKSVAPILKKVKRVIMLSGTPALSRPMELYTQISSIDPALFPFFQDYGVRYCQGKQEPWGWTFQGSSNTDELQIILRACIWIRRLKADVLSQLPPKQRMTVVLNADMVKKSKRNFSNMAIQNLPSSHLDNDHLQLFAKTAEAKIVAVKEYLKEVLDSGRKFLVFGHHKVMLDSLCTLCLENKTNFIRIDGRTSAEERMANVTKFQNRDDVQVAVLSITAANTGITLTAAQLVIFAELYWNPGVLVQAEDRAHRIGQQDSVVVHYLVARNTADDHIWPLIQTKLEVLSKVGLSDDKLDNSNMSYQKGAGATDIRDYMEWNEDTEDTQEKSPRKQPGIKPDIREFLQPKN